MKTWILLFVIFCGTAIYAQNDLKARVEYEAAEEAFTSGNFVKTIAHLEETKLLLKKENPKILYLQILAERELARKDTVYFSTVKKTIEDFEKLPSYKSFPDEKKIEIYKMYRTLSDDKQNLIDEINNKKNKERIFTNYSAVKNYKDGLPIEEFKKIFSFKKNKNLTKYLNEKPHLNFMHGKVQWYTFDGYSNRFYFNANNLSCGYHLTLEFFYDDSEYSLGKELIQSYLKTNSELFGFEPKKVTVSHNVFSYPAIADSYIWEYMGKVVIITHIYGKDRKFYSTIDEDMYNSNIQ